MDKEEIKAKLKTLIESEREIVVRSADQKLDLDSFAMTLIILFVKETFGVQLNMEVLDFDVFNSLNSIADIIEKQSLRAG